MDRNEFIGTCNKKLKLVRTEYEYSQDKMAHILGVSKKTLVEIEKGRSSLGWSGSVTLCSIFGNSEIIAGVFGGKPTDVIMALAFDGNEPIYPQTMGGKIWWTDIEKAEKYKIQQNIISRHYRILDDNDRRVCSNFDFDKIKTIFSEVQKYGNDR